MMLTSGFHNRCSLILLVVIFIVGANTLAAQNRVAQPMAPQTTDFTYQGRLTDSLLPANASYDFEFRLFGVNAGGTELAAVNQRLGVPVQSGLFSVQLNFAVTFDGSDRFLEIAVRPVGGGSFTVLNPRQRITAAPYAIHSFNAASADDATSAQQLGGIAASEFVQITDPRLSDARPPSLGSSNYIQNGLAPQFLSNFNISGDGTAGGTLNGNAVNSTTQFTIGGTPVLSVPGIQNLFVGNSAGAANSGGTFNTFVGSSAGSGNTSGLGNSFVGYEAGKNATTGQANVIVGVQSGLHLTTENNNTIIGTGADIVPGATNAVAIGAAAQAGSSNLFVLGNSLNNVFVPGTLAVNGTLSANGSALTNLNASNLASGTLNNARLGVVPTANGGTGISATGAAGNFLRSDGSVWTSAPLSPSDLPSLGGTYIQNGTAQQATSNFHVSGNGTAGGTLNGDVVNSATQYNLGGGRVLFADGLDNTFTGINAGGQNSGQNNSFFGASAGEDNTVGIDNSFFGAQTGAGNSSGARNSFFGSAAGNHNGAGVDNSFFGATAGNLNTASNNSFFGSAAGKSNTTGENNAFFGQNAGESNTGGNANSFFGREAGKTNTAGHFNSFFGREAGRANAAGDANSFFGNSAGLANTGGDNNAFFGSQSGQNNTTGNLNAFFGSFAGLANNGSSNAFFGSLAGSANTSGGSNTFVGGGAGSSNTTGVQNTYIGAGADGSAGLTNATAIGANANVTTDNTMVLGTSAVTVQVPGTLTSNTVNSTTQFNINGSRVFSVTGSNNTFAGTATGTGGTGNSFFGHNTGQANTTGNFNTFSGSAAGTANNGSVNAFFGYTAGLSNTSGGSNTFVGGGAGSTNTTGSNNTYIGAEAKGSAGLTNATAIGANANVSTDNTMVLGTNAVTVQVPGNLNVASGTLSGNVINAATQFNINNARVLFTDGFLNTVVGASAGTSNMGNSNAIFGHSAGSSPSLSGGQNSFFGVGAGAFNTTGDSNTFLGKEAGIFNTTGDSNTYIGAGAGGSATISGSTAIGVGAQVTTSNTMVLGTNSVAVKVPGSLNVAGSVVTGDLNVTGTFNATIPVSSIPAGSNNYIQNTTSPQATSNFNINGNGTVGGTLSGGTVNATTQFNLGGSRVLKADVNNTFVGRGTGSSGVTNTFVGTNVGAANTTGGSNVFVGSDAGKANLGGSLNAFFGASSGEGNTSGDSNSFFGAISGKSNTSGTDNSFFGRGAGSDNTQGLNNVGIGSQAAYGNTTGDNNTVVGTNAGVNNTTGNNNTVVGMNAGDSNTSANNNTFLGYNSEGAVNITNATAIGANAQVTQSNSLVLGSVNGFNGATADTKVGIGTTAPTEKLTVKTATDSYGMTHTDGTITVGTFVGGAGDGGYFGTKSNHPLHFFANDSAARMTVDTTGRVGIGTTAPAAKLQVSSGDVYIDNSARGVILRSPGQGCFRLTVDNVGTLSTANISCP